jgi:hypothetical protein
MNEHAGFPELAAALARAAMAIILVKGGRRPMPSRDVTEPVGAGRVLLASTCWACGVELRKQVRSKFRDHRHLYWQCEDCSVSWSGPGTVL